MNKHAARSVFLFFFSTTFAASAIARPPTRITVEDHITSYFHEKPDEPSKKRRRAADEETLLLKATPFRIFATRDAFDALDEEDIEHETVVIVFDSNATLKKTVTLSAKRKVKKLIVINRTTKSLYGTLAGHARQRTTFLREGLSDELFFKNLTSLLHLLSEAI